jgi:hypothetical protein
MSRRVAPGVQAVFDEFLQDRGGALDDLARGDAANDVLGKLMDLAQLNV